MRIALFLVGVFVLAGPAAADTFVDGVRYEAGQPVQFVSAAACETAQVSACSSSQSASACGSSASAERRQPVRRLFGGIFRGRLRGGSCQ